MQVQVKSDHIQITQKEQEYIETKINALTRFDGRMDDPSSKAQVHIQKSDIKTTDHKLQMEVTLHVPHAIMRAETQAMTVFEGIDLLEDKLKRQVEKYKEKHLT